jgi:hypothetical protein
VHLHVVLEALHVKNIIECHAHQLVLYFKVEVVGRGQGRRGTSGGRHGHGVFQLEKGAGFEGSSQKLLVAEGFQQVVKGIDPETL